MRRLLQRLSLNVFPRMRIGLPAGGPFSFGENPPFGLFTLLRQRDKVIVSNGNRGDVNPLPVCHRGLASGGEAGGCGDEFKRARVMT